jgi:Domain of unknown function (DUF5667)
MSEAIEEVLAKCLDQMEAGANLESCLADFPEQTAELEPLLHMTQQMKYLTKVGPRPAFARNARWDLEDQLRTSGNAVTLNRRNRHPKQEPKLLLQRRFSVSMLQLMIAAVLALTATTGGAAYAANASDPGDFLHGLDLVMENVQLNLAPDVWSKVQLRLEFASERLVEAQGTFAENNTTDGLEAVNEYGTEISAVAQLIGSADGADQEALALLLETTRGVHEDVLTNLLETVPEQAQESIQRAIDASHTPEDVPGFAPGDVVAPEGAAAPESAGAPDDVGASESVDSPGVDISACATSLSKETAQALVELAKQHGVDHQYVLENFCVLGTLEQVEEMLSELQSPPTDVPAGPPADVPGGPPSDTPGERPSDTPGGPPSGTPGGRPINPPGKP